jgi:hypothetical protein
VGIASRSFGAGHHAAAQAITGPLHDAGCQTRISDIVGLAPGRLGRLVLPPLFGAVDAMMQNSGGFTSLQTLAAGRPVLTDSCLAGHGEADADGLEQAGIVPLDQEACRSQERVGRRAHPHQHRDMGSSSHLPADRGRCGPRRLAGPGMRHADRAAAHQLWTSLDAHA